MQFALKTNVTSPSSGGNEALKKLQAEKFAHQSGQVGGTADCGKNLLDAAEVAIHLAPCRRRGVAPAYLGTFEHRIRAESQ